jgi:DNA processing protein
MTKSFYSYDLPFVITVMRYCTYGSVSGAMQGRLFETEWSAGLPAEVSDDERKFAVALSIVSSPSGMGVRERAYPRIPSDLYHMIETHAAPTTQIHCANAYPGTPLEAAERIIDRAEKNSVRILTWWDRDYPPLLREIPVPPLVLYAIGDPAAARAVAVVGTRMADQRSLLIARRIGRELAETGYTIVSGLAAGIDREAHLGALDAGGRTIGVMPAGIGIVYPWSNRDLYRAIRSAAGSALVSEYPPGIHIAGKWTFAQRNRIISGLCAGTVVVKAGERSGALITARHALEQNREVFACAGHSFDAEYAGCHNLIRSGAVLVSSTRDILDELERPGVAVAPVACGSARSRERLLPDPGTLAGKIVHMLSARECDIDELIRLTGGSPGEVNEAVIALELEGTILRSGNVISRL